MNSRILVTGGAGFIGSNLVRMLLDHDYEVTVYDNFVCGNRERISGLNVNIIEGDILNIELLHESMVDVDQVIHLAAHIDAPNSIIAPFYDSKINVLGTLSVLDACVHNNVQRFVFASTNAVLGRQLMPAKENKYPMPIFPYGASKLAAEGYCMSYSSMYDLDAIILRFSNVYGPFSTKGVIAKFFNAVKDNDCIPVEGTGNQSRDFIHVDDLCKAICMSLKSDISGEVFQIASGVETTITDLAFMIKRITDYSKGISYIEGRHIDSERDYSDITKACELLEWCPEISLHDGLCKTWEWEKELS